MNVLHNFKWPLHGTSCFVRYMSWAQNPSFVWDLISQPSVFVWGSWNLVCLRFLWKSAPSTKENRICGSENSKLSYHQWLRLMWTWLKWHPSPFSGWSTFTARGIEGEQKRESEEKGREIRRERKEEREKKKGVHQLKWKLLSTQTNYCHLWDKWIENRSVSSDHFPLFLQSHFTLFHLICPFVITLKKGDLVPRQSSNENWILANSDWYGNCYTPAYT